MNALPPDPLSAAGPDGIDPDTIDSGKRLVRIGGDKGLSLTERLAERLERLTWRTPLHSLRLKGRYPLKLIAVPDDPLIGVAERGHALLDGAITYRGERRAVADLDFARRDWGRPFAEYVHSFAWLRDLSTVAPRATGAPIAEDLMARWLHASGSHRRMCWREHSAAGEAPRRLGSRQSYCCLRKGENNCAAAGRPSNSSPEMPPPPLRHWSSCCRTEPMWRTGWWCSASRKSRQRTRSTKSLTRWLSWHRGP